MDIRDFILKYQSFLSKRNTKNQNIRFLTVLGEEFKEHGYDFELMSLKYGKRDSVSLYCGDVQKAKTVFVTHYDYPNYIPGIRSVRPFNDKQLRIRNLFSTTLFTVLLLVIGVAFYTLYAAPIFTDAVHSFLDVMCYAILIGLFFLIVYIAKGIKKTKWLEDNSLSVYSCIKLAGRVQNKNVAFAFVDSGNIDRFGYLTFKDYIEKENPKAKIIILDKVGSNDIFIDDTSFESPILKSVAKNVHLVGGGVKKGAKVVQTLNSFDENSIVKTIDGLETLI